MQLKCISLLPLHVSLISLQLCSKSEGSRVIVSRVLHKSRSMVMAET